MLDGKVFRTCKSNDPNIEDASYSGHKHANGTNYQAFVTAHGLTIGFFGPCPGTNHTGAWHYREEGLYQQIAHAKNTANQRFHTMLPWVVFSDGGYPISDVHIKGHQGVRTAGQNRLIGLCNRRGRVPVEWNFGTMMQKYPYVDTYRKMKLGLMSCGHLTHASMLLHN